MLVATLVLAPALLSIIAAVMSVVSSQRGLALDESRIHTTGELDAAIVIQRSARIGELERRIRATNVWPYVLLGVAFLLHVARSSRTMPRIP